MDNYYDSGHSERERIRQLAANFLAKKIKSRTPDKYKKDNKFTKSANHIMDSARDLAKKHLRNE